MKDKLLALVFSGSVFLTLMAGTSRPAAAALCGSCRDLMFTDSVGKCSDCGAPTASAALKLCPKCSARRHQCEHCLAGLSAKDEAAADNAPVAPSPALASHAAEDWTFSAASERAKNNGPAGNSSAATVSPPAPVSPDLPPPVEAPTRSTSLMPVEESPLPPAAPLKVKPINPAAPGTYSAGKWRFQMQINAAGTRNEGRWGWLTYDGQKLPRGNVNDYYETPWGPMYWVDVPTSATGLHGFMPIPSQQLQRQGRALALPLSLAVAATAQPGASSNASAPSTAPAAAKVQTLEINHSHNGQTARVHVGNVVIIRLPGNPVSGYQWQVGTSNTKAMRLTVHPQYSPASNNPTGAAAAGTYTFVYQAVQPGTGSLHLYYVRPGDPSHPRDAFAIGVNVSPPAASASARSAARSQNWR